MITPVKQSSIWDKRIPTILGLLLIVLGVGATTYLTQIGVIPGIGAAPGENPKEIRVTNLSDTTFTVTYSTDESVIGSLTVTGGDITSQIYFDDRDQKNTPSPHKLHSLTVKNLKPSTQYSFSILSGKTTYLNQSKPFSVTTSISLPNSPPSNMVLTGKVLEPNGDFPDETLVYITTDGGQMLSTFANAAGLYVLPLTFRNTNQTDYVNIDNNTIIQVLAIDTQRTEARAILSASQGNPVPTITIGNNYDFTSSAEPLASTSALPVGFPQFALDTSLQASESPQIQVPKSNETFTDQQPVLKGTAQPRATVTIVIHSDAQITTTVTADTYGNWSYRPNVKLSPGIHTIAITAPDQNGIIRTIVRTFTIFEEGTQVAEAATPSATLVPTATLTPTPTALPTPTSGPTTTVTVTATPSPTLGPTAMTTQSPSAKAPTPKPSIVSAGSQTVFVGGLIGLATTLTGIVIFIFAHGAL